MLPTSRSRILRARPGESQPPGDPEAARPALPHNIRFSIATIPRARTATLHSPRLQSRDLSLTTSMAIPLLLHDRARRYRRMFPRDDGEKVGGLTSLRPAQPGTRGTGKCSPNSRRLASPGISRLRRHLALQPSAEFTEGVATGTSRHPRLSTYPAGTKTERYALVPTLCARTNHAGAVMAGMKVKAPVACRQR